jgi:hypothetical protein
MILRSILAVFCSVVVLLAQAQMHAQLAAPGASGVVMGHVHLTARDAAASKTFWAALGGIAVQNGSLQLIQFPAPSSCCARGSRLAAPWARPSTI